MNKNSILRAIEHLCQIGRIARIGGKISMQIVWDGENFINWLIRKKKQDIFNGVIVLLWINDSSAGLILELSTELKAKIPKAGQLAYGF